MSAYDSINIFARILRGEVPCRKVYEDAQVLAFEDILPAAPVHILVVPKKAYLSFDDFAVQAEAEEIGRFFATVRKIAVDSGILGSGYRLITNHGPHASQTVPHFHVHILGGTPLGGLLPGKGA